MQAFNILTRTVDGHEVHELRLREESFTRNLVANITDRICAATGHTLERTGPTSRVLNYLLWLPEQTARDLATIPVDAATARALSHDTERFDELRAWHAEDLADAKAARDTTGDALAAGVV